MYVHNGSLRWVNSFYLGFNSGDRGGFSIGVQCNQPRGDDGSIDNFLRAPWGDVMAKGLAVCASGTSTFLAELLLTICILVVGRQDGSIRGAVLAYFHCIEPLGVCDKVPVLCDVDTLGLPLRFDGKRLCNWGRPFHPPTGGIGWIGIMSSLLSCIKSCKAVANAISPARLSPTGKNTMPLTTSKTELQIVLSLRKIYRFHEKGKFGENNFSSDWKFPFL